MRTAVLLLLAASLALGGGVGYRWFSQRTQSSAPSLINGTILQTPRATAPFRLIDHRSQPFVPANLRDRWSFVFFGFTHCPDVCPTTLHTFRAMYESLPGQSIDPAQVQVVFVSVDPERDSAEKLQQYVPYFHPEFVGVTGTPEATKQFAKNLGVLYVKVPQQNSDEYSVDHSASVFVFDPQGRMKAVLSPPYKAAELVSVLKQLLNA